MNPSHHFNHPAAAGQDTMLQLCVRQGWVPPNCVLDGMMVNGLMQAGKDPCAQCRGPRHHCGGRPYVDRNAALEYQPVGRGLMVERAPAHRFFFLGVDPAPSESHRSDDGALVGGMATPRGEIADPENLPDNEADWWFDFVYARRLTSVERASARQWSAVIHQLHRQFGFEKIVMDPGGGGLGGLAVQRELKLPKQFIDGNETDVTPICDTVNGPKEVTVGYFILHLWKRGDPGMELLWPELPGDDNFNDASYSMMKLGLDHTQVGWPPYCKDEAGLKQLLADQPQLQSLSAEQRKILITLGECADQFKNISVVTSEDGLTYALTKRQARQFEAQGKKDLMSAAMLCYLGFRSWLRTLKTGTGLAAADQAQFSCGR